MIGTWQLPQRFLTDPVSVFLVGCGGTGSQIADGLASLAVTLQKLGHPGFRVTLFDDDRVTSSNIGRQRFCDADIGHFKSLLLQHRINLFYGLQWDAQPRKLRPEDAGHADILITATDSALFRAAVGKYFKRRASRALWIDSGNGPSTGQVVMGHLSGIGPAHLSDKVEDEEARLPNVFDLYPELANMGAADREAPSCSMEEALHRQQWPVNRAMAHAVVNLLWNLFRNGQTQAHGALVDTETLTTTPMPIDPDAWAFWGYRPKRVRRKRTAVPA